MKNCKLFLYAAVLSAIMFGGCQKKIQLIDTEDSRIPPDTLISVSLSETLSQWYTIEIFANGETVYTPTEFHGYNRTDLPPQGVPIKSRISRQQLKRIIQEFENQNFFSLSDLYKYGKAGCEGGVLDAGVITISIEIGGRKKSVRWDGCYIDGKRNPPEFFLVFDKITEVKKTK